MMRLTNLPMFGVLVVSLLPAPARSAPVPKKPAVPEPLPAGLVKAWEDADKHAGLEVGWVGTTERGEVRFRVGEFGLPGEVPGFSMRSWRREEFARRPIPDQPFGLVIRGLHMTDDDVQELAAYEHLTALGIRYPMDVTDAGVRALAALKQLTTLSLFCTQLTDAGVKELAALPRLHTLCLHGAKGVTDVGVKELASLTNLNRLSLYGVSVTEEGAKTLAGLKQLAHLSLTGPGATTAVREELRKALPRWKE